MTAARGRPPITPAERLVPRTFTLHKTDEQVIGEIMRAERELASRSAVVRVALRYYAEHVRKIQGS